MFHKLATRVHLALLVLGTANTAVADEIPMRDQLYAELITLWDKGRDDLYFPFHTNHIRAAWGSKANEFQENTFGFGFGRSLYEDGQWRGIYTMIYEDSLFKPSFMLGYGHQWLWQPINNFRVGGGYSAFLISRSDFINHIPFPGALPIATIGYKKLNIEAAYVPPIPKFTEGNTIFFWGRFELD